ncbi:MAG: hypothetical protein HQL31_07285, partial [Planctomycetes bacterium]|nr:hypothetical protein [Planctomycetota bacterium]
MNTKQGMMVCTWCGWEPLQYYRRLGGFHEAQEGNALWADDWRAKLDSEDCAKALAKAGVNWVTTHFYKGFGLESEAEEIAATEKMITNYHRHGVRVFTYIQYGTIMPETMLAEEPRAAQWGRVDWKGEHDGHPYEYGPQYWRAKPCANQPGFRDYLLRCVDKAVEIGTDGIWIDNLNADGCHCEFCQDAFKKHLEKSISDPFRELGLQDLQRVRIPRSERPKERTFQEWVRFRCDETRESLRLMCERARKIKPGIVTAVNIGVCNHQRALIENGNWFSNLKDLVDYTYAENGLFPSWDGKTITSQQYSMHMANALGISIVPGASNCGGRMPSSTRLRRAFAESAMFGNHAFGGPWGLRGEDGGGTPELMRDSDFTRFNRTLTDWYGEHASLYASTTEAAPVGIYYSFESMIGDETSYRQSLESMMLLLQQEQIPYRVVFSDRLELEKGLRLLILPHVKALSGEQAEKIRIFIKNGGRLLATGRTGLYDEHMRQRCDYILADVYGHSFTPELEGASRSAGILNPGNRCLHLPGDWGLAHCRETQLPA